LTNILTKNMAASTRMAEGTLWTPAQRYWYPLRQKAVENDDVIPHVVVAQSVQYRLAVTPVELQYTWASRPVLAPPTIMATHPVVPADTE